MFNCSEIFYCCFCKYKYGFYTNKGHLMDICLTFRLFLGYTWVDFRYFLLSGISIFNGVLDRVKM